MTWFRVGMWILLAAIVLVILGGYVSQWYRQQVSSSLDQMLGGGSDEYERLLSDEPAQVTLAPERTVSQQEQELMSLDVGYVDDSE